MYSGFVITQESTLFYCDYIITVLFYFLSYVGAVRYKNYEITHIAFG